MKVPFQNETPKKYGFGLKIERIPLGTRDISGRKSVIFKHFLSWIPAKPRTFEGLGGQISLIFIAIFGVQELIWVKKVQTESDGFGPRGSFSVKTAIWSAAALSNWLLNRQVLAAGLQKPQKMAKIAFRSVKSEIWKWKNEILDQIF